MKTLGIILGIFHVSGQHQYCFGNGLDEYDKTKKLPDLGSYGHHQGLMCVFPFIYKGIEYHACSYKEIDVEKQKNGFCATEVGPTGETVQIQSCIKECGDNAVMERTRRYWDWVRHVHQQTRLNAKQSNMKRKRFTYRKDILVPLANYHNAALKNSLYQQLAKFYQSITQNVETTSKNKLKEYEQIRAEAAKDSQMYVDRVKGLTPKYEKVLTWPTKVFSGLPGKGKAALESIRQLGDRHLQKITQIYQAKARAQKNNMDRLVQVLEANWKQANQELKAWKQEYAKAFQAVDLKALQQPSMERAAAITQRMQGIADAGKPLIQGISPALKASLVGEKKDLQELAAAKTAQAQLNEAERQAHQKEFNRQFNLQNGVLTQRLRDIGQLLGSLKKSAQAEDRLYTPRIEQLTQQLVDLKLSSKARQAAIQKLHTQRSAAMSSYFQQRVKLLKDRYVKGLQKGQSEQKEDLQMFEKEAARLKANWQSEVKKASDAYQKDLKGLQTDLDKSAARLTGARERDIAQLKKMTGDTVGHLNQLDQASNAKLKGYKDQFATLEKAHLQATTVQLRQQAEEIQELNKAGQSQIQQASQAAFQNVREIEANLENTLNQGNSAFLAGLQTDSQKSFQQGQQELNRQAQLAAGGLKSSALLEAKAAQEIQKKMEEAENALEALRVKIQKLETQDNASLAQSYAQQTASQQKIFGQLNQGLKDQQRAVNAKEDAYNQVLRKFGHTYEELRIRNMNLSAKFDAELQLHRRKAAEKVNQLVNQLHRSRETHRFELAKALHQGALTIADQRSTSELAGLAAELEFAQQMSDQKMDLARLHQAANQKAWDQTREFNKEIRTLKVQGTADMLGSTDRLVQHLESQEKQFGEANQDFFKKMNAEEDRVVQELEKIRKLISTEQNQQAMAERSTQTKAHQKLDDLVDLQLDLDSTSQKNAHELAQKVDDQIDQGTQETRRDTSTQLLESQVKTAQEDQRLQDQETKHRKATDEAFLATNKAFSDQALAVAKAMNELKAEGLRQELAVKSTQQDRLPLLQEQQNQLSSLATIAQTL